jgi:hypothetical protein
MLPRAGRETRRTLSIIIGMNPYVGRNLLLLGEPDHLHPWRIPWRPAGAAFEGSFQFPDRRIARPPDGVQCEACTRFAALAFDLQPSIAGIEALSDRRRRPRRPAIAFHLLRPKQTFGGVSFSDRLLSPLASVLRTDPCAFDAIAKNSLSIAACHLGISPTFGGPGNMPNGSTISGDSRRWAGD